MGNGTGLSNAARSQCAATASCMSDKECYAETTEEDDCFLGAFREVAAAILEERDPVPSGDDGLRALLVAEALYEAARCGSTVMIEEAA
jgi:predicted dehydrogenase